MAQLEIPAASIVKVRALGSLGVVTICRRGSENEFLRPGELTVAIQFDAGATALDRIGAQMVAVAIEAGDPVELLFKGGLRDALLFRRGLRETELAS
jgi:hypothetical protein